MQAREEVCIAARSRCVIRELHRIGGCPFGPYPEQPAPGVDTSLLAQIERMDALPEPVLVRERGIDCLIARDRIDVRADVVESIVVRLEGITELQGLYLR